MHVVYRDFLCFTKYLVYDMMRENRKKMSIQEFYNTKVISCMNHYEFVKVQKILLLLGYEWCSSGKEIFYLRRSLWGNNVKLIINHDDKKLSYICSKSYKSNMYAIEYIVKFKNINIENLSIKNFVDGMFNKLNKDF